jgi:hypothetical protein
MAEKQRFALVLGLVGNNPGTTKVDERDPLYPGGFGGYFVQVLATSVMFSTHLLEVDICGLQKKTNEDVALLCNALAGHPVIRTVRLHHMSHMRRRGFQSVARLLAQSASLESFLLTKAPLTTATFQLLCSAAAGNKAQVLTSLGFIEARLGSTPGVLAALQQLVRGCPKLVALDLAENYLGAGFQLRLLALVQQSQLFFLALQPVDYAATTPLHVRIHLTNQFLAAFEVNREKLGQKFLSFQGGLNFAGIPFHSKVFPLLMETDLDHLLMLMRLCLLLNAFEWGSLPRLPLHLWRFIFSFYALASFTPYIPGLLNSWQSPYLPVPMDLTPSQKTSADRWLLSDHGLLPDASSHWQMDPRFTATLDGDYSSDTD